MRSAVTFVVALASVVVPVIVPAAAAAAEPLTLQTTRPGTSAPETELEFLHRPQIVVYAAGCDKGLGAGLALRYRWVELGAAGDTTLDDSRGFVSLKLLATPDATFSPYLFGHTGHWDHSEFLGEHDEGDYHAAGVGVDVHTSRHSFLFLEVGYGEQRGATTLPQYDGSSAEVHFGLGARL